MTKSKKKARRWEKKLSPSQKCPHGMYSAEYCSGCTTPSAPIDADSSWRKEDDVLSDEDCDEFDVALLVGFGMPLAEVAHTFRISPKAVQDLIEGIDVESLEKTVVRSK